MWEILAQSQKYGTCCSSVRECGKESTSGMAWPEGYWLMCSVYAPPWRLMFTEVLLSADDDGYAIRFLFSSHGLLSLGILAQRSLFNNSISVKMNQIQAVFFTFSYSHHHVYENIRNIAVIKNISLHLFNLIDILQLCLLRIDSVRTMNRWIDESMNPISRGRKLQHDRSWKEMSKETKAKE